MQTRRMTVAINRNANMFVFNGVYISILQANPLGIRRARTSSGQSKPAKSLGSSCLRDADYDGWRVLVTYLEIKTPSSAIGHSTDTTSTAAT